MAIAKNLLETLIFGVKLSWKSSKIYTIIRIFTQLFTSLLGIISIYFSKHVIDFLSGQVNSNNKDFLVFLLVSISIIGVISLCMVKIKEYVISIHDDILMNQINLDLFEKSINADLELFDSPKYYDDFEMAKRNIYSITGIIWSVYELIVSLISFAITFILICKLNPIVTIALFITSLPTTIINKRNTKLLYHWNLLHVKEDRQMGSINHILTNRNFAQDVRLYNIGNYLKQKYILIWDTLFKYRKKYTKNRMIITVLFNLLPEACVLITTIFLAMNVFNGINTIGDYSLYTGLMGTFLSNIYVVSNCIIMIYDNKMRVDTFKKFESIPNKIESKGKTILQNINSIEFINVSFRYPGTDTIVLKDISFKVEKSDKLCIVGINGAGKTTIIKLILRFYDVDTGMILINDTPLIEYELKSLRNSFSCFFQNFTTYPFTIKDNIIMSEIDKEYNVTNVITSLEQSESLDIVRNLEKGIDTYLTRNFEEDGVELSGGQYQKIALARAFYKDSNVIILDEPSSALDPEAEHQVFQSLDRLSHGKLTIFTSHRLSNITMATKIMVIEDGKIIEIGTHEELMNNEKRYSILYKYQADKYNMQKL
jgi:ABC-type multidrug transport system, ATPase and permease components